MLQDQLSNLGIGIPVPNTPDSHSRNLENSVTGDLAITAHIFDNFMAIPSQKISLVQIDRVFSAVKFIEVM
jgi:hypothetical protein